MRRERKTIRCRFIRDSPLQVAFNTEIMNRGQACDFCDFSFVAAPVCSTEIGGEITSF